MPAATPYNQETSKKSQVKEMFDRIAVRYDFLNHLLSLGIDKGWRKKAISALPDGDSMYILDIATGTGDLAIDALKWNPKKDIQILGVDISPEMLRIANHKINLKGISQNFRVEIGDAENLDFLENTFDSVMVSFGARNFENLNQGLKEIHRVLKPNGKLIILEFSKPTWSPFKEIYFFYFKNILPFLGEILSKDRGAYRYLQKSVLEFPDGLDFTTILNQLGFMHTNYQPLSLGICTLYTALKSHE